MTSGLRPLGSGFGRRTDRALKSSPGRSRLGLVEGSVAEHCEGDVGPASGKAEQGPGVVLALGESNAQDLWIGAGLDAEGVPSRLIL